MVRFTTVQSEQRHKITLMNSLNVKGPKPKMDGALLSPRRCPEGVPRTNSVRPQITLCEDLQSVVWKMPTETTRRRSPCHWSNTSRYSTELRIHMSVDYTTE